jgi:uncharacterized low-complexity protein
MKKFVIAGTLVAAVAVSGMVFAQQTAPATPAPKAADQPAKPKKAATKSAEGSAQSGHTAPIQQPNTTEEAKETPKAVTLGSVRIPKAVTADGKPLAAGTYQVRMTPDEAKGDAKGASPVLERWVEFVKGGKVEGREIASIIPHDELRMVQKDVAPGRGGSKVQVLRGGEYLRIWINHENEHYLVHLVVKS